MAKICDKLKKFNKWKLKIYIYIYFYLYSNNAFLEKYLIYLKSYTYTQI